MTTRLQLTRAEAEDFLYEEARLLDARAFEEWRDLFTDDGIYWLPMYDDADPTLDTSVVYDDARLREMRIYQLLNKPHYAQIPPSRTVHFVSNVSVAAAERDDENRVECAVLVAELREGDHQQLGLGRSRLFAGRAEYRLRRSGRLEIALKKVTLVQRDVPIENLSFLI